MENLKNIFNCFKKNKSFSKNVYTNTAKQFLKKYKYAEKHFNKFGLKDQSIKVSDIKNIEGLLWVPNELLELDIGNIDLDTTLSNYNALIDPSWKVVFSTNTKDILTMSMRGIKSCQRWGHKFSSHLIGSVADPYCGIIYLTNNKNVKYGKKMLARSVVRLISHDNKPSLFLEKSYINQEFLEKSYINQKIADLIINYEEMFAFNEIEMDYGMNVKQWSVIEELFAEALKQFTNKLPVISAIRSNIDNSYIYGSKQVRDLAAIENENKLLSYINFKNFKCLSYCDSGLNYNMNKLLFKN